MKRDPRIDFYTRMFKLEGVPLYFARQAARDYLPHADKPASESNPIFKNILKKYARNPARRERTRTRQHGIDVTNVSDFADPGEARISALRKIVREKQYAKIDGQMVDGFTASAIVQVYDAINDANKAKYRNLTVPRMASIAWKMIKKNPAPRGGYVIRKKSTEKEWSVYNEGAWVGMVYARTEREAMRKARNRWGGDPARFTYKNPAPRIGTRRALRRSQATGRAPSRRLVRRRRRNTAKGFFPNPSQAAALQSLAYGNPMKKRRRRKIRKTRTVHRARRSRVAVPSQFAGLPFLLKVRGVIVAGFRDKKRAIQYGRKVARHERKPVALMKR